MAIHWSIETRPINKLSPHPSNPRKLSKHDAEHLQKSIEKFGLIDKPIINTDNTIIGGHQRIEILKKMKVTEVECYVPDHALTNEDINELNIRLNKNTGEWDWDLLANGWEVGDLLEWGFTEEELSIDLGAATDEAEENGVLEPPKDPITKLGDLYELGEHRLICGDSTLPEVVAKVLDGAEPILMVTDPPYGINYKYNKHKDGKRENDQLVKDVFNLIDYGKVWTPGLMNLSRELTKYPEAKVLVWNKKFAAAGSGLGGASTWEPVLVIDPPLKELKNDVIEVMTDREVLNGTSLREQHPCPKPVELFRILIESFATHETCVYDPFLGSGTTLIAAEQLKRKCYGIELSPAYCDIIVKRFIKSRNSIGKDAIVKKNGQITEEYHGSNTETKQKII